MKKIKSIFKKLSEKMFSFKEKISAVGSVLKEKAVKVFDFTCSDAFSDHFAVNICIISALICAWDRNKVCAMLFFGMYVLKRYVCPYKKEDEAEEDSLEEEPAASSKTISFEVIQGNAAKNSLEEKAETPAVISHDEIDWVELEKRIIRNAYR